MTALKRELPWLREVDSTALQSSLQDLDVAYQNFFHRVKQGNAPGLPRFKSKRKSRKSFRSKASHANIKVLDNAIQLPKLGLVECRVSKQIQGRILSATVSQNPSGKYFVAVCCTDVDIEPLPKTGAVVGIDLGLKDFAVTSDGQRFENHKHLHVTAHIESSKTACGATTPQIHLSQFVH
jgi:putative transposase